MVSSIPNWLKGSLSETDLDQIKNAVKNAELRTSGEIVPMIVQSSCNTSYIQLLLVLLFIVVFLAADILSYFPFGSTFPSYLVLPTYVLVALVMGRLLGSIDWVQRKLLFSEDLSLEPEKRAQLEFYNAVSNQTAGATGILIFISFLEHRVVVLADKAISSKLPKETWSDLVHTLIQDIKSQNLATGLTKAITHCADLLEKDFPIEKHDTNEIRNNLIMKD